MEHFAKKDFVCCEHFRIQHTLQSSDTSSIDQVFTNKKYMVIMIDITIKVLDLQNLKLKVPVTVSLTNVIIYYLNT